MRMRHRRISVQLVQGEHKIPTLHGYTNGLKASHLLKLEHLYRRRVPVTAVTSAELARSCTELSHDIRREIGLLLNRRGAVEAVCVGQGREMSLPDLSRFRSGPRSLRGLRLVRTYLQNEPLTQQDLTTLALLRLDLVAAIGVGPNGLPAGMSVAHIVPPNPQGRLYTVLPAKPFHAWDLDCLSLIESIESELADTRTGHDVSHATESAILISASSASRTAQEDRMDELVELARSSDLSVLDTVIQRCQAINPKYLMGSGKLKDVIMKALQKGADLLVFDQDLTPAQARAIADVTEMKVIDRTQLILDIFARRAHSREGKIQVELAQLRYLLPRLSGAGTSLSRLGGGIGGRGPGETKLETDRRRVRDRIAHLERELEAFSRHRDQRRARRFRHKIPTISIVGYTNAGKSTLLNALTGSQVSAEDRPFETLDTSSRRLRFPRDREVIITDTVGFIRDLPKALVGAFMATLEELRDADLLLHVIDASSPRLDTQIDAVEKILGELGLAHIPRIRALNKCDKLTPGEIAGLCRHYRALAISAVTSSTLAPLVETLADALIEHAAQSSVDSGVPGLATRVV
ncbi:MAG: GTPase HflX [Nitrospirae bacterium RIFCSPLOWO2_02_FULL_62_14]|nr:MAG: GTPase HflX [Nitrospirae bacterium RIFCSPLOWO2_02_FULL_62_14]